MAGDTANQFLASAKSFFNIYIQKLDSEDLETAEGLCKRALELGVNSQQVKLLYLDVAQALHDNAKSQNDKYYSAGLKIVEKVGLVAGAKTGLKEIVEENLPSYISVEQPKASFSEVIGLDSVINEIKRTVVEPFKNPERWRRYFSSDEAKEGLILTGPPGCGKTLLMRAAAGEGCASFIYLKGEEVPQGKETESVDYVFSLAKKYSPSIIFIDECQAVLNPKRTRFVTAMQKALDGFVKVKEHMLIVGNTNKPWEIDTTIRRPGRLGSVMFVPPPDLNGRVELFRLKLVHKPVFSDVNYQRLAELTDSYSPVDIAEVCKQASKKPYDENRDITMSDLEQAITGRKSSITEWFSLAKAQIEKSDERKEVFLDLLGIINSYMGQHGTNDSSPADKLQINKQDETAKEQSDGR